jgi:predicted transcriptional regulator
VSDDVPNHQRTKGEVTSKTAAAVAYWYRQDPDLHPAEIAARIGRSERTVRRHWPPPKDAATPPVNGPHARHVADGLAR